MSLYIRRSQTEALARTLARRTGMSLTDAVTLALEEKLERLPKMAADPKLEKGARRLAAIKALQDQAALDPVLDQRHPDAILYDADGLPH